MAKAGTFAATVGWYATKLLRTMREKIQMEPRHTINEVADYVAFAVNGSFSEPLNARVDAEATGDRIMLTVYPFDEATGEASPRGQIFTLTVTDGYAMIIPSPVDDDDEDMHASWGERF